MGCSHCTSVFPKGIGGPCFAVARKSLPADHPLRKQKFGRHYEYTAPELDGITHRHHTHAHTPPSHTPPLPPTHPLTHSLTHPHIHPLTIGPPKLKDTAFVNMAARRALEGGFSHYLGQKAFPMFQSLMYYSYEGMNMPDWMHNCAGLYKWIMKVIVGPLGDKQGSAKQKRAAADKVHRTQVKINNVFPELWNDSPTC